MAVPVVRVVDVVAVRHGHVTAGLAVNVAVVVVSGVLGGLALVPVVVVAAVQVPVVRARSRWTRMASRSGDADSAPVPPGRGHRGVRPHPGRVATQLAVLSQLPGAVCWSYVVCGGLGGV